MMKCALCDDIGTIHITEIDEKTGKKKSISYCQKHLPDKYSTNINMKEMINEKNSKLRSIIAFAKEQSRFPNSTELQNMRCYGEIPCDLDSVSDFKIKLEFFEKLVEFQEKEGRFPDNDELSDPF